MAESSTDSILIIVAIFSAVLLIFCLLFNFLWQKEMRSEEARTVSQRVGVLPFRGPPPVPSPATEVVSI
jgi:hypothetical protein